LRATRAYITGIGTTGLLIASALLSLAVMSAFVAFNGFPGQDVQDPIGTLLLQEKQAPVNVPAKHVHVQVLATRRAASATTAHRRASSKRVQTPRATTGPVVNRTNPTPSTPSPGQAPSSSGQTPSSAAGSTPSTPVSTTTPAVPDTGITLPQVTLPSLPSSPPPGGSQQQLPIDTSGVTNLLGGG
jgi:hypothetical protein